MVTLNVRDGQERRGHKAIGYANLAIELMGQRTGAYETVFDNDVVPLRAGEDRAVRRRLLQQHHGRADR